MFNRDDVPIGTIVMFAGTLSESTLSGLAAQGWYVCDGRILNVRDYPELFETVRYAYGGAADSFNLPSIPVRTQGAGVLSHIIKYARPVQHSAG